MKQYIDKVAVVAEIDRLQKYKRCVLNENDAGFEEGRSSAFDDILSFLNSVEVKEVSEHNDVDMNHIFEEIGVSPDSHIASLFKNAFYKAVDRYLEKKIEV